MANWFTNFITGGAAGRNEAADAQVANTRKEIRKNYEWEWGSPDSGELGGEAKRKYDDAVLGLEILKRNTYGELDVADTDRLQTWQDKMGIQAYQDRQRERIYDLSVSRAVDQKSFIEIAADTALLEQDRLKHEQLLSIAFDETESFLEYGAAAAGLGLKKRQALGTAATQVQTQRIAALKETGAALARGVSGRGAAKTAQARMAESGAIQTAIVDELMYRLDGLDTDFIRLNQQYAIDQVAFEFSKQSAELSDASSRAKIKVQQLQNLMDAEASIELKPEAMPALAKPVALYRPEFKDIFKPGKPPMSSVADAPKEDLFTAGFNTVLGYASTGLGIASSIKGLGK